MTPIELAEHARNTGEGLRFGLLLLGVTGFLCIFFALHRFALHRSR